MNRTTRILLAIVVVVILGVCTYHVIWNLTHYVVEWTEYRDPPETLTFVDDRLEDRHPAFDESLVDSRPLGDWQVNKSSAVIRLDSPAVKPDQEAALLVLRPSYADALRAARAEKLEVLPGANLLDGAAKQFDDGLVAALEVACFRGELGLSSAVPVFLEAVFDALPGNSPARPFLGAALTLAGKPVDLPDRGARERDTLLAEYDRNIALSKPISFYTWTPELKRIWRCFRFLQQEFTGTAPAVPRAVARVLAKDGKLLAEYRAVCGLYARLTNPAICLSVDALIGTEEGVEALAARLGVDRAAVSILPPATSTETELFNRVFGDRLPAGVNLMATLIHRIRSGEVDLTPGKGSGWVQHQVFALETMLLPGKGREGEKLLLTAAYKKRLVEAFKALITRRRETHARSMKTAVDSAAPLPRGAVRPRLRVEPCATFYLRTARAYDFLQGFLLSVVGKGRLERLHGLRRGGMRKLDLACELGALRQRFYGFTLVSCEDIGLRPQLYADETVDRAAAKAAALAWLERIEEDADISCDTRVAVPIFQSLVRNRTRLWATLGVRFAHLKASYARPPRVRPLEGNAADREWRVPDPWQLGPVRFVIPVDAFAEIEVGGSVVVDRAELRAVCDRHKTREDIIEALSTR